MLVERLPGGSPRLGHGAEKLAAALLATRTGRLAFEGVGALGKPQGAYRLRRALDGVGGLAGPSDLGRGDLGTQPGALVDEEAQDLAGEIAVLARVPQQMPEIENRGRQTASFS